MFAKYADFHSYGIRNRDTVHMTTCRLNLRKHSIRFSAPNYGTVSLSILKILTVFIHLSGIIMPFLLTILYISTVSRISIIVLSLVLYIQYMLFLITFW